MTISAPQACPLHLVIAAQRERIIESFVATMRHEGLTPSGLTSEEIVDHLRPYLDELSTLLRAWGDEGALGGGGRARANARIHGEQRWQLGQSLGSLVREYGALRECIIAAARGQGGGSIEELNVLADCLNESVAEAVAEHARRNEAEAARREVSARLLAGVGGLLAQSLDYEQTLSMAAEFATAHLADGCAMEVLDERGVLVRHAVAARCPNIQALLERSRERAAPLAPDGPLPEALGQAGATLVAEVTGDWLDRAAHTPEQRELLEQLAPTSAILAPLIARGRPIGLMFLVSIDRGRRFDEPDRALAEELAMRVAAAVDNARLFRDLGRALQAREEILAVVSHDLRNPLNVIQGNAALLEAMLAQRDDAAPLLKMVGAVRRSGELMARLTRDLLDLARMDAGKVQVERCDEQVGELVQLAFEAALPQAEQRGVVLTALAGAAGQVSCDRDRVLQVFANLLGNAIKFTAPGKTVALGFDPHARFFVADEGPGIPDEQQPHLFEAFWQAPETAKRGTGLGLAIASGIVQAHGGRLWVESRVGRGSTFYFTLPTG